MGSRDYAKLGDYNVICDTCGFKRKFSETKLQWDNKLVCQECYEERHPQDFVRGLTDKQTVPIARPPHYPTIDD